MRSALVSKYPGCAYADHSRYRDRQILAIYGRIFPKNVVPSQKKKSQYEIIILGFEVIDGYETVIYEQRLVNR